MGYEIFFDLRQSACRVGANRVVVVTFRAIILAVLFIQNFGGLDLTTSEQYRRVGELYHAAMELAAEARSDFLAGACGDDVDARRGGKRASPDLRQPRRQRPHVRSPRKHGFPRPQRVGRFLTYPEFAFLRGDPRLAALGKKVGLLQENSGK
jgi:hypothetical protein